MSSNYVQVRFESKKYEDSINMILHNTRKIKPSYLRKNLAHNRENNVVYIDKIIKLDSKEKITEVNDFLKQQLKNELEVVLKTKNFREKKHAITQDCVITLSNSINDMYQSSQISSQKLNTLFYDTYVQLQKELGLEGLYFAVHYDEKTPHAHCSFKNYYNGRSISNTLKKDFSKAQDIAGAVWGVIGFGRGVKKEITHSKHLKIVQMHQEEEKNLKREIRKLELYKSIVERDLQELNSKYKKILENIKKFTTKDRI